MYVVGDWVEGNVENLSFGDCWFPQETNGKIITHLTEMKECLLSKIFGSTL